MENLESNETSEAFSQKIDEFSGLVNNIIKETSSIFDELESTPNRRVFFVMVSQPLHQQLVPEIERNGGLCLQDSDTREFQSEKNQRRTELRDAINSKGETLPADYPKELKAEILKLDPKSVKRIPAIIAYKLIFEQGKDLRSKQRTLYFYISDSDIIFISSKVPN